MPLSCLLDLFEGAKYWLIFQAYSYKKKEIRESWFSASRPESKIHPI